MSDETSTPASERVREGYDALPGEEQAVDYECVTGETRAAYDQSHGFPGPTVVNQTFLPAHDLEPYFELAIEVRVQLPDGTTMEYSERVEKDAPDDYDFDEAFQMLSEGYKTLSTRLNR